MNTKKFPDYTREELLETLASCYSALVGIYQLTKEQDNLVEIYTLAKEPLDEMFERTQDATS